MKLEITVNVFLHPCSDSEKLEQILQRLTTIEQQEKRIMATLDETLAAVTDESTKEDSLIALVVGIKAQLDAVLSGQLPADVQAKVDAVFAGVTSNATKVQAAIDANSATPTPAPTSASGQSTT